MGPSDLDNDWRKHNPEFREPKLSKNLMLVERPKKVAARYGRAPGDSQRIEPEPRV
jgi:hypothetical protein